MLEDQLTSHLFNEDAYETEIAKNYTIYLSQYPEIFCSFFINISWFVIKNFFNVT